MATLTFNDILNSVAALPDEDQDRLFEVIRKRRADAWCENFMNDTREAERDLKAGKLKVEPHEKMKARLRESLRPLKK